MIFFLKNNINLIKKQLTRKKNLKSKEKAIIKKMSVKLIKRVNNSNK